MKPESVPAMAGCHPARARPLWQAARRPQRRLGTEMRLEPPASVRCPNAPLLHPNRPTSEGLPAQSVAIHGV